MKENMAQEYSAQLFIDGEFVPAQAGATMPIIDPSTGSQIGSLAAADAQDVDRAVNVAQRAFESGVWRDMPVQQRARILNTFADLFEADIEQFFRLETLNNGRPVTETRAQIARLPQFYRYFAALALTSRRRLA